MAAGTQGREEEERGSRTPERAFYHFASTHSLKQGWNGFLGGKLVMPEKRACV